MMILINWLFDASGFMKRSQCGVSWSEELIISSQLANILIALCYYLIPLQLYYLYKRRKDEIPKLKTFKLFIFWPLACGISRICSVLSFYYPAYRFFVLSDWLCA